MAIKLEHALAYSTDSSALFAAAVAQVEAIAALGTGVFPPATFPDVRRPVVPFSIVSRLTSDLYGPFEKPEAAGFVALLIECSALASRFARGNMNLELNATLKLPNDGWSSDAIGGMSEFGVNLSLAAGVRSAIKSNKVIPTGSSFQDYIVKDAWNWFERPLRQDDLVMGKNTAQAIVDEIGSTAKTDMPLEIRIFSKTHGANLARNLYLEVKDLATKEFAQQ